ncbi:HAD family hydrolase [Aquimarina litoralis]|uniref:HAD family hydrolase n=1 Tax=Aquimarina litoralis TaxID=584605 RepID=UPI001C56FE22|nr:HAD family hydrolase [Aquimarina litoralis]MBW1295403.1 HAD-IA family hydrolase [Aquimarina litoralis]
MTLVFDLDNTLINRNKAYWLWLKNDVLSKLQTIDKNLILHYDNWGYTSRHHFYKWLIKKYKLSTTPEILTLKCANELHNYVVMNYEILAILERLEKQYKLIIATNGGIQNQTNKLKAAGILNHIEHVYISEEIGYRKPDHNFYKHIQKTKNYSSSELMMIGDHYLQDYLTPRDLGWKSIWLSHNRPLITHNNISSLKDLISYLREK